MCGSPTYTTFFLINNVKCSEQVSFCLVLLKSLVRTFRIQKQVPILCKYVNCLRNVSAAFLVAHTSKARFPPRSCAALYNGLVSSARYFSAIIIGAGPLTVGEIRL